jgi:hypothetical protein
MVCEISIQDMVSNERGLSSVKVFVERCLDITFF